jgi:2-polyprenyl-3-methyl-5-hydroxy-6-metoxy-1,4-benzoquinol methylase
MGNRTDGHNRSSPLGRFEGCEQYARYEAQVARFEVLPFLLEGGASLAGRRVVDVGCGLGGVTSVLAEEGAVCLGVDINPAYITAASELWGDVNGRLRFVCCDITSERVDISHGPFDVAILRDVLEHVPRPPYFLNRVVELTRPGGEIFVSFPCYYSAFGGHQHPPGSPTRFMPWVHLLPMAWWAPLVRHCPPSTLKLHGSVKALLEDLRQVRQNRITIARYEQMACAAGLRVVRRRSYITRPAYRIRYGVPVLTAGCLSRVSGLREVLISGANYLMRRDDTKS